MRCINQHFTYLLTYRFSVAIWIIHSGHPARRTYKTIYMQCIRSSNRSYRLVSFPLVWKSNVFVIEGLKQSTRQWLKIGHHLRRRWHAVTGLQQLVNCNHQCTDLYITTASHHSHLKAASVANSMPARSWPPVCYRERELYSPLK